MESISGTTITLAGAHGGQRTYDGFRDKGDLTKIAIGSRVFVNGIDTGATVTGIAGGPTGKTITTDIPLTAVASKGAGISFYEPYDSTGSYATGSTIVGGITKNIQASSWNANTKTLTLKEFGTLAYGDNTLVGSVIRQNNGTTPPSDTTLGYRVTAQNGTSLTLEPINGSTATFDTTDPNKWLSFHWDNYPYEVATWNASSNILKLQNNDIAGPKPISPSQDSVIGQRVFIKEGSTWVDTGLKVKGYEGGAYVGFPTGLELDGDYLVNGVSGFTGNKQIEFRPELSMTLETPAHGRRLAEAARQQVLGRGLRRSGWRSRGQRRDERTDH
ncbi:MAG: hypothetical protein EBT58_08525 [Betaproteobacteria bacterium]|nr:hypothetical protein [Betaproteobacteria bacterium]